MPDEDQDPSRPNLEPPSLFGRKKRADPDPEPEVVDDPTDVLPVSDPTWMFEPPPEDEPEPEPLPEPLPEPPVEPPAAALPAEAGVPLFADEVEDEVEVAPAPPKEPKRPRQPKQPRAKKPKRAKSARVSAPSLPTVSGWAAAAVTGVVIGLLLVGMTAGSLQACEAVRGTSTCGGTGVPILLVIMAVLIAIGGYLLRVFHVPDPGSTSFLAVGMVAVIALLFLLDFLLSLWMLLVIPLISVAMYLLAYWVTTAFVEPAKEPSEL
jgi:hypothetical protein